jgi:hypothetical protein
MPMFAKETSATSLFGFIFAKVVIILGDKPKLIELLIVTIF